MNNARTEIEQAFIGGLLQSPKQIVDIADKVALGDFNCDMAKKTYANIITTYKAGGSVDPVTVMNGDMSLATYITVATDKGFAPSVKQYARKISAYAKAGRVNTDCQEIIKEPKVANKLDRLLSLYQREMFIDRKAPGIKEVLKRFNGTVQANRQRGSMGISTGFRFLDELYIQYIPGHVWTIGAFTSVGKTAMMIQKICNLLSSDRGVRIVIMSTEMTEEQMIARILSNFTGVPSPIILSGKYRHGEEEHVEAAKALLANQHLTIYDDIYTLGEIETAFRKAELQGGLDIGFIDYVQNCQVPEAASSYQEQSTLAKRIQKLAKDTRSTIVCLSQVSNDVARGNTDNLELKGAGEWAAVSDLGIMLMKSKNNKFEMKYAVKKNRHGKLHDHIFEYKNEFSRLEAIKPALT